MADRTPSGLSPDSRRPVESPRRTGDPLRLGLFVALTIVLPIALAPPSSAATSGSLVGSVVDTSGEPVAVGDRERAAGRPQHLDRRARALVETLTAEWFASEDVAYVPLGRNLVSVHSLAPISDGAAFDDPDGDTRVRSTTGAALHRECSGEYTVTRTAFEPQVAPTTATETHLFAGVTWDVTI